MNLLFWNLHKHELSGHIVGCLSERDVDIALFAEHSLCNLDVVVERLGGQYRNLNAMGGCDKIRGVVRANLEIDLLREQSRYTMFEASGAGIDHLIIVATHLPDRRSDSDSGARHEVIRDIVADIQRCESERNPAGTVVIGDFNANPYDRELVAPDAFNAVLFKDIIRQNKSRTWNCKERSYLYNPVIDRLSEEGKMYGSYYYAKSSCSPYWNCFDQALVSRSLVDCIGEFRYLREIGGTSLMSEVRPSTKISDHLPLFVSIEGGRA